MYYNRFLRGPVRPYFPTSYGRPRAQSSYVPPRRPLAPPQEENQSNIDIGSVLDMANGLLGPSAGGDLPLTMNPGMEQALGNPVAGAPIEQGGMWNFPTQMPAQATGVGQAGAAPASGGPSGLLSTAGPWAALAAVIGANETWANKEGRRPEDFGDHMTDLVSGKVLEYDADALADNQWIDGIPGLSGLLKWGGKLGNPEGLWEVGEVPIQWLGGLFD